VSPNYHLFETCYSYMEENHMQYDRGEFIKIMVGFGVVPWREMLMEMQTKTLDKNTLDFIQNYWDNHQSEIPTFSSIFEMKNGMKVQKE
jgi:hypothetical protein